MSNIDGYNDDYDDSWDAELDPEVCGMCGGDGELDAYEMDPLFYAPGDTTTCPQCGGDGNFRHLAGSEG